MDLDAYRDRVQSYVTAWNAAHHARFAGHVAHDATAEVHAAHRDCTSDAALDGLAEAASADDRVRRLWRFAVAARLRAATAAHDAERTRREATSGLARLTAALAEEPGARRRRQLEEERLAIAAEALSAPAAAALERVRTETRALGWPSPRALLGATTGADLGALAAHSEALLRERDAPALGEARTRADLPRWHRAAWADDAYGPDALLPSLEAAVRAAGRDLGADGIHIDATPRAGKSARAFVAALRVPGEIVVVVAPRGGRQDAEALFHEAGHALDLAARPAGAPVEDRHLDDAHRAEAAAFTFEARVPDRGDDRLHVHAQASVALRRRRQAARLLHELDLLDHGPVEALRERYARRMATATGLDWPGAPWLVDADPLLTAADYVRGDALAAGEADPGAPRVAAD